MKISWILVLASASIMTGCVAQRNVLAPIAYQDEVDEAEKSVGRGNSLQAIDDLTILIQMNPHDARAIFLRGIAFQNLERFDKAIEDFQRVLKVDPKHAKSDYNLGMIYAYKINEPKLALGYFDRFLDIDPKNKQAFSVAKIMVSLDGPDRMFLTSGSQVEHILDQAHNARSLEDRRSILETGMKENPNSPLFPYMLGQTYDQKEKSNNDDLMKAKSYYEKTLSIRPTCAPCRKSLGNLLIRQGQIAEGQSNLLKASLFDPSSLVTAQR